MKENTNRDRKNQIDPNSKVVTICYGDEQLWLKPLREWLKRSCPILNYPVSVISMGEEWVKREAETNPYICRHAMAVVPRSLYVSQLNPSGILLAEACRLFAPCMIITLDCEVLKPLEPGEWMESEIALGGNHYMHHIGASKKNIHEFPGIGPVEEYNCAVQWCGSPEIGDSFDLAWQKHRNDERIRKIKYWEQIIWSLVFKEYRDKGKAAVYPQSYNWSSGVPDGGNEPHIRHWHGTKRKAELWKKWEI